jgi:hypothetical protein
LDQFTDRVVVEVELGVVGVIAFDCVVGRLDNDAEVVVASTVLLLLANAVVEEFEVNVWSTTDAVFEEKFCL